MSFCVSFELEANYHVQLKIYFCFHGPFLKRTDMLCFSVISVGAISVKAWQGLKSWYTITMAFGLESQAQAKTYAKSLRHKARSLSNHARSLRDNVRSMRRKSNITQRPCKITETQDKITETMQDL